MDTATTHTQFWSKKRKDPEVKIVSTYIDKKRNQCTEQRRRGGKGERAGERWRDEGRLEGPGQACQTGGSAGAQACR